MTETLHIAGSCPCCHNGSQIFRRCDDGATLVVMCAECNAVWLDPADLGAGRARGTGVHTFEITGTALRVGGGAAGWATREELERAGWAGSIVRSVERKRR